MTAAPGLLAEIARSVTLGAGWECVGCCPNSVHTYGFHLRSSLLPAGDYSLSGALNRPVGDHCCAVDITTTSKDARKYVAAMFERWRAGKQPVDQAEFIGSPNGTTVYYASWKKPGTVELYRGTGHDHWCHSSKFRSLATRDGRWFDPDGPFLGPILGNTSSTEEESALVAVTDKQWADLVADVDRLNKQSDRLDDVIAGAGAAYPQSNLAKQLGYVVSKITDLSAKVDALGARLDK